MTTFLFSGMIYVKENLISTEMILELKMLYSSINDDKPVPNLNDQNFDFLKKRFPTFYLCKSEAHITFKKFCILVWRLQQKIS